jgi:hypothetical protein
LICYAQVQTYDPLQLCVHTALTLAEEIWLKYCMQFMEVIAYMINSCK